MVQLPQLSVPPHPSGIEPQFAPWAPQVVLSQQTWAPVQVCEALQLPQSSIAPHPSGIDPHVMFCATHVVGTQPHTLVVLHV